jgi:hypothetical protein
VLKFPDDRRTEGFSTQTTNPRGSSGVGGGIHEQRDAAERHLVLISILYSQVAPSGRERTEDLFFRGK